MLATTWFSSTKNLSVQQKHRRSSTRLELGIFFLQDLPGVPAVGGKKGPAVSGTIWLVVNNGS